MKIKLETIAKKLKISGTTVSRALRNHPGISDETRTAVIETANRLGYKVSYSHKGRKLHAESASLKIIALISGSPNIDNMNPITHEMLKGVSDALNMFNGQLTIDFINDERANEMSFHSKLSTFDGAIFIHRFADTTVKKISEIIPCVSSNYRYELPYVDSTAGQDIEHMAFLVKYLHEMGHSNIGYIDVERPHPRAEERYIGFITGLLRLGIAANRTDLNIMNENFPDQASKFSFALKKIQQKKVTAWACGNDYSAFRFAEFLIKNGIKVPDDVSITGFAGLSFPNEDIKLCTFKIPFEEIGREAAKHLVDRIKLPGSPARQTLIDCEFIKGNTVKKLS
ncbi:MAG: hypothetical protein A2017_05810 [Lentisphaerae bacterium GWF2_44_16]|nr:MAG: hypothetical protein A2017_05810 [Lentisphaerae bacterium GWF2_44_16]